MILTENTIKNNNNKQYALYEQQVLTESILSSVKEKLTKLYNKINDIINKKSNTNTSANKTYSISIKVDKNLPDDLFTNTKLYDVVLTCHDLITSLLTRKGIPKDMVELAERFYDYMEGIDAKRSYVFVQERIVDVAEKYLSIKFKRGKEYDYETFILNNHIYDKLNNKITVKIENGKYSDKNLEKTIKNLYNNIDKIKGLNDDLKNIKNMYSRNIEDMYQDSELKNEGYGFFKYYLLAILSRVILRAIDTLYDGLSTIENLSNSLSVYSKDEQKQILGI